jgi:L-asparaginase
MLTPNQISKTHHYMTTPITTTNNKSSPLLPSALATATYAVTLLEQNPLFNAGHGAVFTRDGINELEASVMVSRGHAKRGVGVSGLRRVRNPILLARAVLERGEGDLLATMGMGLRQGALDVPSAQGHTHIHGAAAEQLAEGYGLEMVEDPKYFWTERRWLEHVRGLEREREGKGVAGWCREEYLPQGTVGAVAVDEEGVVCAATSTGGLTNKLTGRVGDTPTVGAGFWAEEWVESGYASAQWRRPGPAVVLSETLRGLMAECLPTPWTYAPLPSVRLKELVTTRSLAISGTGNGDSFLRIAAARTVGSIARFAGDSSSVALSKIAGPGGELQRSTGDRWGRTGEGEGGMIGIECVVTRNADGRVVETRSELLQDYNCGGMFRAWVDDKGVAFARVFREDREVPFSYADDGKGEDLRDWSGEKLC